MPSVKAPYKYLVLAALALLPFSCSVEKNTPTTRFYQGLTSRYNIYFNGNESFKAGVTKVIRGYNDDYAELLRVFEYSDPTAPQRCTSDMERAIQKSSKLISLKSMSAKPEVKDKTRVSAEEQAFLERKEYNDWVDDAYLLIGKARFYKQEYNEATAVLDYCTKEANDPELKKEASIWLARICNETGRYADSYRILKETDLSGDKSATLKAMYYTTLADLYIKQKKFEEAVDPLEKSIKLVSGKHSKYRLTYLLAQLNERAGNSEKAVNLYRDVTKMNPPYDVEFNARINMAGVFDVNSGDPKEIRKELERMLRDSKNKEFHDQIYYALGNLSIKEGKETEAKNYYTKSASSASSNPNQKGRTYLALADYYFRKSDFIPSAKYYDSTVMFIDLKFPDYQTIKDRSINLNSVVSQLEIIQREDSLQKVAAMSESQRNQLISGIIEKVKKDESQGKINNYNDMYNLGQFYENERRFQNNIEQEGKWYFYNQTALTFGRTEFKRRWGSRKLEDYWRTANKSRVSVSQGGNLQEEQSKAAVDTSKAARDFKSPEFYLKNLPLTDSLLALSNARIADACLNAGKAYSEKLSDPKRATEEFETLLRRYPKSDLVPETLYNLWKTEKDINPSRAETYRQRLVKDYPNTEFARILSDPDYYKKKMEAMKQAESLYEKAYAEYTGGNFPQSLADCETGLKAFPDDPLAPKFKLLHAYGIAASTDEKSFREDLSALVKAFPTSNEGKRATEIIAFLDMKSPELKVEVEKAIAQEIYTADTTSSQSFILVIPDPKFNINLASFDVISYNIDNFTNRNFRTEGELVDNRYITIRVSGFKDYAEARSYFDAFRLEKVVRNSAGTKMYCFLIGSKNLAVMSKDKNPERYMLYFRENYGNGGAKNNK